MFKNIQEHSRCFWESASFQVQRSSMVRNWMENNTVQLAYEGWEYLLGRLWFPSSRQWSPVCLLFFEQHVPLDQTQNTPVLSHLQDDTFTSHSNLQWMGSPFQAQTHDHDFEPIIRVLKPSWLAHRISPCLRSLKVHEDHWDRPTKGSSIWHQHRSCQARLPHAFSWCQQDWVFEKSRAPCQGTSHVKDGPSQWSIRRSLWLQTLLIKHSSHVALTISLSLSVIVCKHSGLGHLCQVQTFEVHFFKSKNWPRSSRWIQFLDFLLFSDISSSLPSDHSL